MRARLCRGLVVLCCSLLYFAYVFQLQKGWFLHRGLGDWIDPYFINYVLEDWHHSVHAFSDPSSPPMFFPAKGTLGYSVALILYVPFYLAARPFLHPFQAYTLTLFLVLETGALSLYVLLRKGLALRFVEALLLSVFFFTSANVVNGGTGTWSQRASVFLIPHILLTAVVAARMRNTIVKAALWFLVGLGFTLLFTQDFYTGEFVLFISMLLLAGAVPMASMRLWRGARALWRTIVASVAAPIIQARHQKTPSVLWLVVALAGLILAVVVRVHPMRPRMIGGWEVSAQHPVRPLLVAVLAGAWFAFRKWQLGVRARRLAGMLAGRGGDALRRLGSGLIRIGRRRDVAGLACGAAIGSFVFAWVYLRAYVEHHSFPEGDVVRALIPWKLAQWWRLYPSFRCFALILVVSLVAWMPGPSLSTKARLYAIWIMIVSVVVLLIPIRFNTFSIWTTLVGPLPGFAVVRDPKRIIEVFELTAALVTAFYCARLPVRSVRRTMLCALLVGLLAADWNRDVFPYRRSIDVFDRWVASPIRIDASCGSFFIKAATAEYASRSDNPWALYGIDAMFISLYSSIPTLNGYSALVPAEWILWNPEEDVYAGRVARWIASHQLRDVCELDIAARTMRPSPLSLQKR